MDWLEEWIAETLGADEAEDAGFDIDGIAKIADAVLDADRTRSFVERFFITQKRAAEFIGVGESTMAGWLKKGECPTYAKHAMLAAYFMTKHWQALDEAKRDAGHPKVVRDGDAFSVVQFKTDAYGVTTGEVLARNISSEKTARVFASSVLAWLLAAEMRDALDAFTTEDDHAEHDWLRRLRKKFYDERLRAFDPDKLRERAEKIAEAMRDPSDVVEVEL